MKDHTSLESPRSVVSQSPKSIKVVRKPAHDSAMAHAEIMARDREYAMYQRIMSKRMQMNGSHVLLPPPDSGYRLSMQSEQPPREQQATTHCRPADEDEDFDKGVFVLDL